MCPTPYQTYMAGAKVDGFSPFGPSPASPSWPRWSPTAARAASASIWTARSSTTPTGWLSAWATGSRKSSPSAAEAGVRVRSADAHVRGRHPACGGDRGSGGVLRNPRREAGTDLRWTDPEQLHLTLAFLPEVSTASVDRLIDALGDGWPACRHLPSAWPRAAPSQPYAARVLFAGVAGAEGRLESLARAARGATACARRRGGRRWPSSIPTSRSLGPSVRWRRPAGSVCCRPTTVRVGRRRGRADRDASRRGRGRRHGMSAWPQSRSHRRDPLRQD